MGTDENFPDEQMSKAVRRARQKKDRPSEVSGAGEAMATPDSAELAGDIPVEDEEDAYMPQAGAGDEMTAHDAELTTEQLAPELDQSSNKRESSMRSGSSRTSKGKKAKGNTPMNRQAKQQSRARSSDKRHGD
ncbi:MAG TPA: hypothetical protein VEK08_22860 [Planctomycetota bacterium]|nr:hypothetical protein [Planctomycetota bacterium]